MGGRLKTGVGRAALLQLSHVKQPGLAGMSVLRVYFVIAGGLNA